MRNTRLVGRLPANVRFAPEAVVLENYIPQRKAEV
jgi:hypothetical protein